MATYGGELSLARFLVLEGRAIPFDVAHVVANVVFALVAGPAMLRMLVRFRERFEWKRRESSDLGGTDTAAPRPSRPRGSARSSAAAGSRRSSLPSSRSPLWRHRHAPIRPAPPPG